MIATGPYYDSTNASPEFCGIHENVKNNRLCYTRAPFPCVCVEVRNRFELPVTF